MPKPTFSDKVQALPIWLWWCTQVESLQDQVKNLTELKTASDEKHAVALEREAKLKEALDAEVPTTRHPVRPT